MMLNDERNTYMKDEIQNVTFTSRTFVLKYEFVAR